MVIGGVWRLEEDGVTRPIIEVEVAASAGTPINEWFLVDTGADCTVFTSRLLAKLALHPEATQAGSLLQGLGGDSDSVTVQSTLAFQTMDGKRIAVRGTFTAAIGATTLDMSILGRDVLANFDVVISRRRNEVLLVAGNHGYAVTG